MIRHVLLWSELLLMFLDIRTVDLSLIQHEVDALEELSRQLFLETVDLQATKVTITAIILNPVLNIVCLYILM